MYRTAEEYLNTRMSKLFSPYTNRFKDYVSNIHDRKKSMVDLEWKENQVESLANPKIFGPPFWFTLHVSALHYPIHPSPIVRERMKGRILAIPFEVPCMACKPHAAAFIESNKHRLDEIVSSKDNLFNFYVDFHNKVNQRYGKRIWTYDEAKRYYSGGGIVSHFTYKAG